MYHAVNKLSAECNINYNGLKRVRTHGNALFRPSNSAVQHPRAATMSVCPGGMQAHKTSVTAFPCFCAISRLQRIQHPQPADAENCDVVELYVSTNLFQ